MFVSIYLLLLVLLLFLKNKKDIFSYPKATKYYSVSILVPAYNEERTIASTLEHIYRMDYPNIKEVIVINDGSKDNTLSVLKKLEHKYKNLILIDKKNSGKADSLNKALRICKGELVIVVDADSYPEKDALKKMVGYFDDPKVGAVTPTCIPRNKTTLLEKLQTIEYGVIAFTRKLLEYIDSIYVVPGTLGVYRKIALEDIGGFDTKNITEDIEATWHLLHNNWKVKMSLSAGITTEVPDKIAPWYKQRRRWALGGLQCVNKYKSSTFRENMFGFFVVPFFVFGWLLGITGILIFLYLIIRRTLSSILLAKYSIASSTPIITMNEFYITPNVLNYFGIILFVLFFIFTLFQLSVMKDKVLQKQSFFNLLFYMTIYLLVYPLVLVTAIWHLARGKMVWR
jgi:poly-beta-1,6 N-acetyl-D-glucosamine synthase